MTSPSDISHLCDVGQATKSVRALVFSAMKLEKIDTDISKNCEEGLNEMMHLNTYPSDWHIEMLTGC